MERLVIAGALVIVAVIAAGLLSRRGTNAPTQARVGVPTQLDRKDFDRPDAPWLVAVFTSNTCESCERATAKAKLLESASVAYAEIEWHGQRRLHDRYAISDVPLIVMADDEGVVRRSFVGTPTFADLSAALAEAREPGSTPDPEIGLLHRGD